MSNHEARSLKHLLDNLSELQQQTDYQFEVFKDIDIKAWKDLWKPLVKDATLLANNGNPDLGLSILDQANLAGFTNPWTEESRAKILTKLGRQDEALSIWEKLTKSKNKKIQEAATKSIDDRSDQQRSVEELVSGLNMIIQQTGRKAKYLPDIQSTNINEFENPILAESSRFLKSELAEVSLQILEVGIKAGLQTPAIEEKRAKTLWELKRGNEAVQICESMLKSKNENAKQIAEALLKDHSEILLAELGKIIKQEHLQVRDIPKTSPRRFSKLEQPVLKLSNELFNKKKLDASLLVLKISINHGLSTPLIKDMQARVLLKKKNYSEAVQIWRELVKSDNLEANQSAKRMLQKHSEDLNNILRNFLLDESLPIQYLPKQSPGKLLKLEKPLLQETTKLIESKKDGLALRLLKTSIKHGLDTDLIKEAKAKALLSRNRIHEAVVIWQSLLQSKNKSTQESAQKNLDLHLKTATQQNLILKVDKLLQDNSDKGKAFETAIDLLTDALLQDPTNKKLQEKLQGIAIDRMNQNDPYEGMTPELIMQQKSFAGLEALLSSLEKRQKT